MTLPRKKRNFRKIVVNDVIYNWRFRSSIDIRPDTKKNNKLSIDIGWYDEWLYMKNPEDEPKHTFPRHITPKFIERLIHESIKIGWDIESNNHNLQLQYVNEEDTLSIKSEHTTEY